MVESVEALFYNNIDRLFKSLNSFIVMFLKKKHLTMIFSAWMILISIEVNGGDSKQLNLNDEMETWGGVD